MNIRRKRGGIKLPVQREGFFTDEEKYNEGRFSPLYGELVSKRVQQAVRDKITPVCRAMAQIYRKGVEILLVWVMKAARA